MEPTKRLFRPTLVIILIAVLVLVLAALGAYFYYFSSPGKYWHAKGQKSGAEATKKAEFNLNEAMRIVSENYAYSLVEQPLLDTTGNALSKTVVKKEEVVVFGKAKTFDWSFGLQFRQIHLIDQITFRPTGQGGWVTSASLFYFTSPKEAWEWGHRERKETAKKPENKLQKNICTTIDVDVKQYSIASGWVATPAGNPSGRPGYNCDIRTTDEIWCHGSEGVIGYKFYVNEPPTTKVTLSFIASSEFRNKAPDPYNVNYSSDVLVDINGLWSKIIKVAPDDGIGKWVYLEIPEGFLKEGYNVVTFKVGPGELDNGLTFYTKAPIRFQW